MAPDADANPPAPPVTLATPLAHLPGVSARRAKLFARLGVDRVSGLIRHLPMRYEHEAAEGAIVALPAEGVGSARGEIAAARWVPGRGPGRRGRFEATLTDESGTLHLVWFNAGYLRRKLHPGMTIRVQGKVKAFNGYPQLVNPSFEHLPEPGSEDQDQAGGPAPAVPAKPEKLRPIYPATEDLPSAAIERVIEATLPRVLGELDDALPAELIEHHAMPPLAQAFAMVHAPEDREQAAAARRRLAFNELLLLQLGIAMKKAYVARRLTAPALRYSDAIDRHIRQRFPFEMTRSQRAVIGEIVGDLTRTRPMNRLVQGDVGSGKTAVALYALLLAVLDGKQGAMMAPTELLAEQHFASVAQMLEGTTVRLQLLTGGQSTAGSAKRREALARIASGQVDIVIGTHALVSDAVAFHDLALAVVDEQHRFGVRQRARFRAGAGGRDDPPGSDGDGGHESEDGHEGGHADRGEGSGHDHGRGPARVPHQLVMTATPIPRTLSLTIFGDLDVSTIHGLPPGRTPVSNRAVEPDKAQQVYRYLRKRLERGEQAYVVVPAIDPDAADTDKAVKTVREHAALLQDKFFQGFKVGTVHGRLTRETREAVMGRFRRGEVQVLVATTVIEVGVDVPGATVMVIEHAERFGLAQLHQLRGRIGRGSGGVRPLCVFINDPTTEGGRQRIDAIASTNDGFKIAEVDLQIRGMGEFFGTRQSGMPPLRVAKIPEDMDLLQLARRDAMAIVEADPTLAGRKHQKLRRILLAQYGEALGLIDVG